MLEDQVSLDELERVKARSYSPYSNYQVAAILFARIDGDMLAFPGTNVENASYGLTLCAERSAIAEAVSRVGLQPGGVEMLLISASPCGACRQWIAEFKIPKIVFPIEGDSSDDDSLWAEYTWQELLPHAFEFEADA